MEDAEYRTVNVMLIKENMCSVSPVQFTPIYTWIKTILLYINNETCNIVREEFYRRKNRVDTVAPRHLNHSRFFLLENDPRCGSRIFRVLFPGSPRANSMACQCCCDPDKSRAGSSLRKRFEANLSGRSWRQYRLRNLGNYLKLSLLFSFSPPNYFCTFSSSPFTSPLPARFDSFTVARLASPLCAGIPALGISRKNLRVSFYF